MNFRVFTAEQNELFASIVETVVAAVRAENGGSLRDCCTDVNMGIRKAIIARKGEVLDMTCIARVRGVFIDSDGDETDHEWLRIGSQDFDPTAEQFRVSGYSADTHRASRVEW